MCQSIIPNDYFKLDFFKKYDGGEAPRNQNNLSNRWILSTLT